MKRNSKKRTFWEEIKLYFRNKGITSNKTMLVKKDRIVRKDKNVAKLWITILLS